jgi:hypothetical protein
MTLTANKAPARGHGDRRGLRACLRGAALALLLAVAASCAHTIGAKSISFRVECNVPDATVWIDDVLVGSAKSWESARTIRAGFHRVELRHPGYYSFFQEVELPGGSQVVVNAKLREVVE